MKSIKERGEKNAVQVPFVSASTAFRHAKLFLKQPVAEALINNDPLTLRVPVNGAKSDRLLTRYKLVGRQSVPRGAEQVPSVPCLDATPGAGQERAVNRGTNARLRGRIPASGARRRAEEGRLWGCTPRTRSLEEWRGKVCVRPRAASSDRVATRPLRPKLAPAGSGRTPQTRMGSASTRHAHDRLPVARKRGPAPRYADPCPTLWRVAGFGRNPREGAAPPPHPGLARVSLG